MYILIKYVIKKCITVLLSMSENALLYFLQRFKNRILKRICGPVKKTEVREWRQRPAKG